MNVVQLPNKVTSFIIHSQELYRKEQLTDYTVSADGQSFRTHRNLLASVSDYFRVMLTGDLLEAHQDHVDLKGVSASALKELLEFAYTGTMPTFAQC